jgi:hypothetical protein
MEKLSIHLQDDQTVFAPRGAMQGSVRWSLETAAKCLELSLLWHTEGKGTRDVGVVQTATFDCPGALGSKDFEFTLPDGPCSFSGRLISVIWSLEVSCSDINETVRQEIVVSPTGKEIALGSG